MAEGVGNAPTSTCADPVFGTGAASLYLPAFLKRRVENAEFRMRNLSLNSTLHFALSTLHLNWLPDLDSHQDRRFNRPPCYFDTIWQWRCRHDSHVRYSV